MLAKFKVLLPNPTHCVLKEVWDVHKTGQVPLFSKKVLNFLSSLFILWRHYRHIFSVFYPFHKINSSRHNNIMAFEIRYYNANSLERRYRIHHWIPMFFGTPCRWKSCFPSLSSGTPPASGKVLSQDSQDCSRDVPISPNPGWACFSLSLGPRPADDGTQFYEVSYFINICVVTFQCFPF